MIEQQHRGVISSAQDAESPAQRGHDRGTCGPASRCARWTFAASIFLALLVLAIRVDGYHRAGLMPDLVLDDAYISFRYARNLVRGHGLVYNVGERVEGYTNFLWTVAVAGAMAGGAAPEPATEVLGVLAAAGTILLLAGLARRLIQGPLSAPVRFLPPVLFAAIESQARHVVSGMETLLFGFLIFAAFACLVRGPRPTSDPMPGRVPSGVSRRNALAAGALFGLAALTRPEGVLYAGIGALCALWEGSRGSEAGAGDLTRKLRAPVFLGLGLLAFVGPHLAWRWSFYGYPLPNTYYAKVAGSLAERLERGWESLRLAMGPWDVWPVLVLAILTLPAARRERFWIWAYGVALATWAYFLLVGGDFAQFFGPRLLMPALPFVLLLAAEGLRRAATTLPGLRSHRGIGRAFVVAIALALGAYALWPPWPTRGGPLGGLASVHQGWRETGEWLAREAPPEALVATSAAGIVPYVSDRPTLDMFGLTDAYIAHHAEADPNMPPGHGKSDPRYVLERRPDYLHVVRLSPEGVPVTARLGWVADRIALEYELVAQVKSRRGPRVEGRWLIETDRFRPGLYRRGYTTGIFRRIESGADQAGAGLTHPEASPGDLDLECLSPQPHQPQRAVVLGSHQERLAEI